MSDKAGKKITTGVWHRRVALRRAHGRALLRLRRPVRGVGRGLALVQRPHRRRGRHAGARRHHGGAERPQGDDEVWHQCAHHVRPPPGAHGEGACHPRLPLRGPPACWWPASAARTRWSTRPSARTSRSAPAAPTRRWRRCACSGRRTAPRSRAATTASPASPSRPEARAAARPAHVDRRAERRRHAPDGPPRRRLAALGDHAGRVRRRHRRPSTPTPRRQAAIRPGRPLRRVHHLRRRRLCRRCTGTGRRRPAPPPA